jgi:hypothetical protein
MADFGIRFTGDYDDADPYVAIGEITLGDESELLEMVVDYWSIADYEAHWLTALRRLIGGATVSCLLTSVSDPETANFMVAWPLYRVDDEVYVQNHYIALEELDHPFDIDAPWESVYPRSTINEDGQQISEWHVSLEDVRDFLASASST